VRDDLSTRFIVAVPDELGKSESETAG
jgi:hypothetical protein